jgi:hypothetical protein
VGDEADGDVGEASRWDDSTGATMPERVTAILVAHWSARRVMVGGRCDSKAGRRTVGGTQQVEMSETAQA